MTKLGLLTIYYTEVLTLSSAGHLFIHSFQHIFTEDNYAQKLFWVPGKSKIKVKSFPCRTLIVSKSCKVVGESRKTSESVYIVPRKVNTELVI